MTGSEPDQDGRTRTSKRFVHRAGPPLLRLARKAASADLAELVGKPLGLRYLECANVLLADEPPQRRGLEEKVGRMSGACRLATARLAGDLIIHGTAQTARRTPIAEGYVTVAERDRVSEPVP